MISVSLSAGAAQIEADDKIGKLVRRADEALYAAKLGGRNRSLSSRWGDLPFGDQRATQAANSAHDSRTFTLADADAAETASELSQAQVAGARIAERLQRMVEEESRRLVKR